VAEGRPYADVTGLFDSAEQAWLDLEPTDWAEALAGHPRLGERGGGSADISEREQRSVLAAGAGTLSELAQENRRYEARFGHVFLIAAVGKSADEILFALRARMDNDPVTEARVVAGEHRKIARMRLQDLVRQ
jgi:2-oxo-4-hydroxy-4-carboxy-5-ureidoimidazoline decarboxylase